MSRSVPRPSLSIPAAKTLHLRPPLVGAALIKKLTGSKKAKKVPAMTTALRGGGNDEDGSTRDGSTRDAQLVDSRGREMEASTQKPASKREAHGKKAALVDFLLVEGNPDLGRRDAAMAFGVVALPLRPHGWHRRCMTSLLSSLSTGGLVLGCAFRFVFRFLQGLIWWNPLLSAESAEFCGTHVGIKSFQRKIDLFRNPTES